MAQLVTVILAIILLGVVVSGGISYFNSDVGVRSATIRSIQTAHHALESGLISYRVANRGVVPATENQSGDDRWRKILSSYAPASSFEPIEGLHWKFVDADGEPAFCLTSVPGATPSNAVREALAIVGSGIVQGCDNAGPEGVISAILELKVAR